MTIPHMLPMMRSGVPAHRLCPVVALLSDDEDGDGGLVRDAEVEAVNVEDASDDDEGRDVEVALDVEVEVAVEVGVLLDTMDWIVLLNPLRSGGVPSSTTADAVCWTGTTVVPALGPPMMTVEMSKGGVAILAESLVGCR